MKNIKLKKIVIPIIMTTILFTFPVAVTMIFIGAQDKIQNQILKNSMERLEELSDKITNTIHLEIKNSIHTLKSIEELSSIDLENLSLKENLDILKSIKNRGNFISLGIINSMGEIAETDGEYKKVNCAEIIKNFGEIKKNKYYVSDILSNDVKAEKQEVLVAIPLYNGKNITGVLFGHYPITDVAENIVLSKDKQQYFQIVDTKGQYISRSGNENALSGKTDFLWEELKKYKFFDGSSAEQIKKNVENHKSGFFYFESGEKGRYVLYKPLGINNWYLFSVLTKQNFNFRVEKVQNISKELLIYLTSLNILLLVSVVSLAFYVYRLLKEQSRKIEIKNSMLKMLVHKTNDIIFEVHIKENKFIFYRTIENEDKEFSFPLDFLKPENLLKNNLIREENFKLYKELYDNAVQWKTIEKKIIELKVNNSWKWFRIYSIVLSRDNIIGILEDFTEEREKDLEIIKINEKSKYDFLTGLYNRETFEREFEFFIKTNKNTESVTGLFLIDLDNFKTANDTLGHGMGDKILQDTSSSIKHIVRSSDLSGRLGGDEFVLLIKNASDTGALEKIAQKLNSILRKSYSKDDKTVTISASIGITVVKEKLSLQDLYEKADSALYRAKEMGRDSYYINY